MKTSTLRKLPVPFVVACLLGVAVLSFLLFSPGAEEEKTAQVSATSSKTSSRASADSSRYGTRSGVAKLVRSGGNNSRTSSQTSKRPENRSSKTLASNGADKTKAKTSTKSVDPNKARQEQARREIAEKKAARQQETDRQLAQQKAAERKAAAQEATRQAAERQRVAQQKQKQAEEARVAATTPPRRDLDSVKSATVATTTQPTTKKAYSPENPDPSVLLSQTLGNTNGSGTNVSSQLEINEPDTVMPPGFNGSNDTMTAPKIELSETATKSEPQDQGSTTRTMAATNTAESSVVTGELTLDADTTTAKRVRIINPSDNSLPVWFVTQKHKIQLKPGQRYEISTDEQLHVRFARGGDFGVERVVAEEGDWVFSVNRTEGWKLTQN